MIKRKEVKKITYFFWPNTYLESFVMMLPWSVAINV